MKMIEPLFILSWLVKDDLTTWCRHLRVDVWANRRVIAVLEAAAHRIGKASKPRMEMARQKWCIHGDVIRDCATVGDFRHGAASDESR